MRKMIGSLLLLQLVSQFRRRTAKRVPTAGFSRRALLEGWLPGRQADRRALLQLDLRRQIPARRAYLARRRTAGRAG